MISLGQLRHKGSIMRVGYARTSTLDQIAGFEAQIRDLEAQGCERIFREQVSSVAERPQLAAAIDYLRDGDSLVVTKLDRLARSISDLMRILDAVQQRGARLCVLDLGSLDPETPQGKLMLTMLGAINEFERKLMLERQREGIAAAKAAGKYKGRKPTARMQADEVKRLAGEGVHKAEIARRLGMHRASVYRILGETEPAST
jgi:DNA invertase Pin-like site-specific DNA recombinase